MNKKLEKLIPKKALAKLRNAKLCLSGKFHGPSTIQLLYRIDVYDKQGKLYKTTGDRPSHSFVIGFSKLLELMMAHDWESQADSVAIVDTGGTTRNTSFNTSQYITRLWASEAPAGNTSYGILVGTGETSPESDDYCMQTLIAHGSGSDELQYGATSVGQAGIVGANIDLVINRVLVNGSGDTVQINEAGLVVRHAVIGYTTYYFLIIHDEADQAVPNGYTAYVTYTIRTTV